MSHLLLYFLYFIVGSVEWFLAICRISAQLKGRIYLVSTIIVLEVILGFFVFEKFFAAKDWLIVIVYSLGCGSGPILASKVSKQGVSTDVKS